MIARSAIGIVTLVACGIAPVSAQSRVPDGGNRFDGVSFMVAQLASTGSMALYATRKTGRGMLVVGMQANARTDYRAAILGGGTHLRLAATGGLTLLVAGALATDGPSARLYVLSSIAVGRVAMSGTATVFHPLGGASRREAAINPLTVTVRATPGLAAGVAFVARLREHRSLRGGLGPAVQVRTVLGRLSAEIIPVGPGPTEARFTFTASF